MYIHNIYNIAAYSETTIFLKLSPSTQSDILRI